MSGKVKRIAEHVEEPALSSNQLFIFTMTYCQRTEEACALRVTQLLLLSIPRYVFAVHPVKPYWTASAFSCQQLELTELRQTQLKSGKTVSHLTWIFSYTYFWQIHASLAALCCIYRTPIVHCCKLQITRGLGISLKACYVFCEAWRQRQHISYADGGRMLLPFMLRRTVIRYTLVPACLDVKWGDIHDLHFTASRFWFN